MTRNATTAAALSDIVQKICALLAGRMIGFIHQRRTLNDQALALVTQTMYAVTRRFNNVMIRLDAGTLRRPPARQPAATRGKPATPQKPRGEWPHRLRTTPGWLYLLIEPKHHLACYADTLHAWIKSPDLQPLLVQAPQLRRILRPLCTMIGVELPPQPEPPNPASPPRKPRRRRAFNAGWPWFPRVLKDGLPPGIRPKNYEKIA